MNSAPEQVFISYAGADQEFAAQLRNGLGSRGFRCFDYNEEYALELGRAWEPQLEEKLKASSAVIFLASSAACNNRHVGTELMCFHGLSRAGDILAVLLEKEDALTGMLAPYAQNQQGVKAYELPLEKVVEHLERELVKRLRNLPLVGDGAPIGREQEVAQLLEDAAASRLIVIWGGPGMGKTSFARVLADAIFERSKLPSYWVQLANKRTLLEAASQTAKELKLKTSKLEEGSRLKEIAAQVAQRGPLLVVFDNIEQLAQDAKQAIAELVTACPQLTAIVTVRGEAPVLKPQPFTYRLPSLPVPDLDQVDCLSQQELEAFPAVQLYQRWRPGGTLDELRKAARICCRVGGIPAVIKALAQNAGKIGDSEDSLKQWIHSDENPLIPTYAYLVGELLDEDERRFLFQLAAFRGRFSVAAASAIFAAAEGTPNAAARAQEIFQHLERCGLVEADDRHYTDEQPDTYLIYWPLRELAEQRWQQDVSADYRQRHAAEFTRYFLSRAEQCNAELHKSSGAAALDALSQDIENLFQIFDNAFAAEDLALAAEVGLHLVDYCRMRGPVTDLLDRLEDLHDACGPDERHIAPRLNGAIAALRWAGGQLEDWQAAVDASNRAVRVLQRVEDPVHRVHLVLMHSKLLSDQGDLRGAAEWLDKIVEDAAHCPGWLRDRVELNLASTLEWTPRWREGLERLRTLAEEVAVRSDPERALQAHNQLGLKLFRAGQAGEALEHFREAQRINRRSVKDSKWIGGHLTNSGIALSDLGEYEQAVEAFQEARQAHLGPGGLANWDTINAVSWARAECNEGLYQQALDRLQESRIRIMKIGYYENRVWMHMWGGIALLRLHRIAEALEELTTAEAMFRKQGRTNDLRFMTLAAHLAEAHLANGDAGPVSGLLTDAVAIADDYRAEQELQTRHFKDTARRARAMLARQAEE